MIMLKYDFELDLATARSRMSTKWKNATVRWSELLDRCSQTVRTPETMAEYLKMTREEQGTIKDVGGFVAGYLSGGMRKSANVISRSAVTLDLDFAEQGAWENFARDCGCAAMVYSTHKHTDEKPRLRLVIPSSRAMTAAEYEAVARYWAARVGIEMVDHTTYDLNRLYYWPSTAKGAPFFFDYNDAPAFDPEAVLATYRNYRDASEWPTSTREGDAMAREMKQAGDPEGKPGLIGAFCRAYTIEEVIGKYLGDVYEPTAHEGRYTYRLGHVAGGLICYEGKFAYSHHETDPASQQLCNAFDLVRVHLFGLRDEGSRAADITKRPSYLAMQELAAKDGKVRELIARERIAAAAEEFGLLDEEEPEEGAAETETEPASTAWLGELDVDKRGTIRSTANNVVAILENDPKLAGHIWHDQFSGFDMVEGGLPWDKKATQWGNRDDANLRVYLEKFYGITGKDKIKDAKDNVLTRRSAHPIRDYLSALTWDGTPRLDTLIIDYLGAEDCRLTRAMTRKHFAAAVARVMTPGCKYDHCLVLAGPEGAGKSTLLSVMGGAWFNDSVNTTDGKNGMEQIRRAWIIELGELSAVKRSDVESLKAFFSRQIDVYRPAYGQVVESYPRQCVFCGTTNEEFFLKGDTGNRRFWPVCIDPSRRKVSDLRTELKANRDQIWAEAVERWRQGEKLFLDEELEAEARERQKAYNDNADDPMAEMVELYVNTRLPRDWAKRTLPQRRSYFNDPDPLNMLGVELRERVCPAEFLCERLGRDMGDKEFKTLSRRVGRILVDMGWEGPRLSKHAKAVYGLQRSYWRPIEDRSDNDL